MDHLMDVKQIQQIQQNKINSKAKNWGVFQIRTSDQTERTFGQPDIIRPGGRLVRIRTVKVRLSPSYLPDGPGIGLCS
jgi:hypothetical protein